MMKRIAALLLILCLTVPCVSLADMNNTVLTEAANAMVWHLNDVDLVVRTMTAPFLSTSSSEDWELNLYIDFVELAYEGVTAMRFIASTAGEQMLFADEMSVTVGKKTYTFTPSFKTSEYDMMYYEDYYVCLGDEGLALITDLMKGKGTCQITLRGDVTVTGKVTVPASEVKALYNLYKQAGGLTQDLSEVDARWPVTVGK